MKGQDGHDFPQFFMPFKNLLGRNSGGGGIFHLIRMFLILFCLLNAVNGGLGNIL